VIRNPIIYQRGVVSPVGDPVGLVDEEVLVKVWAISSRACPATTRAEASRPSAARWA
jgi:hypothetical protein